jgi:dTDP-4-dehydrorhamnose 3,5-epimerase
MGAEIVEGVYYYPLNIINTTGGSVMHAIKDFDDHFTDFGECYFSTAESKSPKAWKKHSKMICNLFVPQGEVQFVFYDDRPQSKDFGKITEFKLSRQNYGRLVIHPGIWFGFSGISNTESIIFNIVNIKHDPAESERLEPGAEQIPYTWEFK